MTPESRLLAFRGCLLGGALGDALLLPREGLSPRRSLRLFGDRVRPQLLPGVALLSDDTEHALMTAQALAACGTEDAGRFARSLGWRLRWWFAALPPGVGMATARACIKLWFGWPAAKAGVFSAGNGPAMRASILGAALAEADEETLRAFVRASTRLTHSDPAAEHGALAVAFAARYAATTPRDAFDPHVALDAALRAFPADDPRMNGWKPVLRESVAKASPPEEFLRALSLPRGPSGYIHHTLPAVLYAWLRSPHDLATALDTVRQLGGDADSVGAIAGGIVGASGAEIPTGMLRGMCDWPRSLGHIHRVAEGLHATLSGAPPKDTPLFWPGIPFRNLAMLLLVLAHGFLRLVRW